jgi:hypothetical protein
MDELEDRRRRRDGQAAPARSPEEPLDERDREAARQDERSDARDLDAKEADQDANVRDRAAEDRDERAEAREVQAAMSPAQHSHPSDRRMARQDRENAAHDRDLAVDDRGRARRDRKISKQERDRASDDRSAVWDGMSKLRVMLSDAEDNAEDMLVIGKAQGLLMEARDLDPTDALLELCLDANRNNRTLLDASRGVVGEDPARLR